jgi:3-hydroxymyristoyl/3-hydroxydecanoyl-(acyl carrier protein) dehydratase
MSQPHSSKDLQFVKHATKPSTYVPGHRTNHYVMGGVVIAAGFAMLVISGLLIFSGSNSWLFPGEGLESLLHLLLHFQTAI